MAKSGISPNHKQEVPEAEIKSLYLRLQSPLQLTHPYGQKIKPHQTGRRYQPAL